MSLRRLLSQGLWRRQWLALDPIGFDKAFAPKVPCSWMPRKREVDHGEGVFDATDRAAVLDRDGKSVHIESPTLALGAAYFAPLRSWASGGQALATASEDAPDSIRARRLVSLCLGPARRNPNVRAIQKRLFEFKEIE